MTPMPPPPSPAALPEPTGLYLKLWRAGFRWLYVLDAVGIVAVTVLVTVVRFGTDWPEPAALVAGMVRAGWQVAPPLSVTRALHMLIPETPVAALAVWPTLHDGHVPAVVFVHDSQAPDQRWVLRFWASGYISADQRLPIWLGTIDRQSRHEDLRLMVTARDQAGYDRAGLYLATQLAAQGIAIHWPDASGRGPLLFSLDGPAEPGTDADLVVLNARATQPMALRMETAETLSEELFVLQTLGDDRAVVETYAAGKALKS